MKRYGRKLDHKTLEEIRRGMSVGLFVEMLKLIMARRRRPLFLILDSLPAHKAKVVRDYVEGTSGRLRLYFLPGHAPELNPDELVCSQIKRNGR